MGNGKVLCGNCNSEVVPRLWHKNRRDLLLKKSIEHICPICGTTMYKTGGGPTIVLAFIMAVIYIFGGVFLADYIRINLNIKFLDTIEIFFIIFWLFMAWYINKQTMFILKLKMYFKK